MSSLLLPAILLLGSASITTPDVLRKCGQQPPGSEPLYAIDGVILGHSTDLDMDSVDTGSVHAIEVVCMNPSDSTFNRSSGVPVLSIWTKDGPVSRMKPMLSAMVEAQDAHRRANPEYARSATELTLPDYPAGFRISIDVRDNGWLATLTLDRYFTTCYVFDGDAQPAHVRASPREPYCLSR